MCHEIFLFFFPIEQCKHCFFFGDLQKQASGKVWPGCPCLQFSSVLLINFEKVVIDSQLGSVLAGAGDLSSGLVHMDMDTLILIQYL